MIPSKSMLEIKNLRVHFDTFEGTAQVLDGVSFSLHKGDSLGLVGETGCGKSITVKAVLQLLPIPPARIASGEILFEGRNLLEIGEEEIQQIRGNQISMIFQDPVTYLNPVFTIEEQLVDVILAHQKTRQKGTRTAKAPDGIGEVQTPCHMSIRTRSQSLSGTFGYADG